MNSNETLMEQIRRLNEEQARIHEQRRIQALNKIKQMRLHQREKENGNVILE